MKINIKIYAVLIGILLILFTLVTFLSSRKNVRPLKTENYTSPTYTSILSPTLEITKTAVITPKPGETLFPGSASPTPLHPDFTGAQDETFSDDEVETAKQRQTLRSKLPMKEPTFLIDYDYGKDTFTVTLSEPRDQSQQQFANWLNENYPKLKVDEFVYL